MEHLVTFKTAEGRDGNHTATGLDDALRFVERLRNNEDASEVRVFRMQEVPIEFRSYFKVEVAESKPDAAAAPEDRAPEPAERAMVAAANGEPTVSDSVENSRRLFQRG